MYDVDNFLRKYSIGDKHVFIQDVNRRIRGKINPWRVTHMYNIKNKVRIQLKASNNIINLKFATIRDAANALIKIQEAIDNLKTKTEDVPNTIKKYVADQITELGSDKFFMFRQQTPVTTWVIPHNLNKKSSVTVTNDDLEDIIGLVKYIDNNNIEVRFNNPVSGWVFLN